MELTLILATFFSLLSLISLLLICHFNFRYFLGLCPKLDQGVPFISEDTSFVYIDFGKLRKPSTTMVNMKELKNAPVESSNFIKKQMNPVDPSKEEQNKFATPLLSKPLKKNDKWFLINTDWFTRWANYVGLQLPTVDAKPNLSAPSPDKIDNKRLLDSSNQLKADLTEETDYFTIPEELWKYLTNIYSITQEEDVIERHVIDDKMDGESALLIEIRPLTVKISCSESAKKDAIKSMIMSRQTPLVEVVNKIRSAFNVPPSLKRKTRLFFKSSEDKSMHPCKITETVTLNNSGYGIQDIIHLEFENTNGTWPSESSKTGNNTTVKHITAVPIAPALQPTTTVTHSLNTRHASANFSNRHHEYKAGLCGLSNLGNTCFMNSSIQMMSNVAMLTDYFRSEKYKSEVNSDNPLGQGGHLAKAYADLINELWSGNNNYTMPRNFKLQIGRFAPQFTGFQQQDSHELLAFLLDGLHEDLNRIIKKPYVEMGSHVGKTDEQFANESWQDHLKRNDSIIVDLFHGLLKSTLNCLTCNEISIKFDPFCYLSLPLPSKKERLVEVFFVPLDLDTPITKLKVSVLKNGTIGDLCSALVTLLPNVQKDNLVVCDVYTCKFFKVYEQSEQVSLIRDRDDIYIYELSSAYNSNDYLKVKVHLKEKSTYQYSATYFGLPLFLTVAKKNLTYGSLYQNLLNSLKRFIDSDSHMQAAEQSTANTSSEEINSKLSDSLNVKDEEFDDNASHGEADSSEPAKEKTNGKKKLFNLVFCKNDSIEYDNHQLNDYEDETPLDWQNLLVSNTRETYGSQSLQAAATANQVLSVFADFGQNFNKRFYNKKPIDNYAEHPSLSAQLVKKKDVLSLHDCFSLYTKTEKLSENDYWFCSKCKNHEPSTKKFDLWSLPKVLVLQLKRFSYSRNYRDKIDTLVDFPIRDLDLSEYLIQKNIHGMCTKYNLLAVSNHYGSLGGGHYTAYCMNRNDQKWYYFDDSSVSGSDESSVCTHNAYLLTYIRQDCYNSSSPDTLESYTNQEKMDY